MRTFGQLLTYTDDQRTATVQQLRTFTPSNQYSHFRPHSNMQPKEYDGSETTADLLPSAKSGQMMSSEKHAEANPNSFIMGFQFLLCCFLTSMPTIANTE